MDGPAPIFPCLSCWRTYARAVVTSSLPHLQFLADEVIFLHPITLPVWCAGLGWFLFHPQGKSYRFIGWAFLLTLAALLVTQGRTYYLAPAFPMLLAGGAVAIEGLLSTPRMFWLKTAFLILLMIGGAATMPLFLPLLSPQEYVKYARILRLGPPRIETFQQSPLPQYFADRFGWPEMAQTVESVYYYSLPI